MTPHIFTHRVNEKSSRLLHFDSRLLYSEAGDTQRDEHIRAIAAHGRIVWQRQNDYGLRSRVELAIQRYKRIIGNCMKARALPQQKTEAWFSASALNMMTNLGMPVSVKI
jgi:hypothetical protein